MRAARGGSRGAALHPASPGTSEVSEGRRILRAAGTVGAATLSSRVLGYVRDMVIAWYFGAGSSTDAFIAAFRIPNLLRRLFGEGTLSATFIPVFTETLYRGGRGEAMAMARSALRVWAAVLTLAAAALALAAPWIMHLLAYGFRFDPQKFTLTVSLARLMAPYIFFVGLVALCMGILNPLGHFAAPALAPVVLNLAMIAAVLFAAPLLPPAVDPSVALAVGVVVGGILQLAMQLPFLAHLEVMGPGRQGPGRPPFIHPALRRTGRLLLPTILGSAVYQVNILCITFFASMQAEGSLSCLYFADRLMQFPLGLFGITIATAALPSLARQAAAGDLAALKATTSQTLRVVLFITLPAAAGMIVLREPIVRLLFQRGAFDTHAVRLTADALLYYAVGLAAVAGVRIVVQTLYALQDTRTPVLAAGVSIGVNLVLMAVLAGPMGPAGLALAVSIASALNLALLLVFLRKHIGPLGGGAILGSTVRCGIGTAAMAAGVWLLAGRLLPPLRDAGFATAAGLAGCIVFGAAVYAAAGAALKSPELRNLLKLLRGKEPIA